MLDIAAEEEERVMKEATALIPACVMGIAEYWREKRMEQIVSSLSDGKSPRAVAKGGRNDPCSCGSGKKFKECCGKGSG